MSFFIPFNKFDLIASEKVGIQKNWIMRIENQLCMMDINFIIVKDIDDIHQSHWVERSIELINNQCTAVH